MESSLNMSDEDFERWVHVMDDTHEVEKGDYLTPGDVAEHFGVSPGTVYIWIERKWLKVHPRQKYERYRITLESFNEINEAEARMAPKLRRFLPRVLYGRGW